jgi:predicted MFS family arabinose efflux permease
MAGELLESTVYRKVTLRLMPFLGLAYFLNILDRSNIDIARLRMLNDTGISKAAYGLGAGIFFIGYFALEVPSNLILSRVGARRWIARIMVTWGIISGCMMFVENEGSFYLLRFLLGCAEAGFFPGILLYLTYWFPARQRARAVALFMAASPLTWVIGGPLSGWILDSMSHVGGLAGWQWLFLLEAVPSVVLGVVTFYYLTDRPQQANWLTEAERSWLTEQLAGEEQRRERRHDWTFSQAAAQPKVWHLVALASTIAIGIAVQTFFFAPLIADRFGKPDPAAVASAVGFAGSGPTFVMAPLLANPFLKIDGLTVGLLKGVAGICTLIAVIAVGAHSDRTSERRWHIACAALVAAIGWGLSIWRDVPVVSYVGLVVAYSALLSMWGPFWSLATTTLGSRAAAGGIAMINALLNLAAFSGPYAMGRFEEAGSFAPGLAIMALMMILTSTLVLSLRQDRMPAKTSEPVTV